MRILHTADWHLGDRLGRIDRTDDLRLRVERIAGYCTSEKVDVLLVAGDIFSELARPDALRDSIRHLQETFEKFLRDGGTIVAITGNHDNEGFCETLLHAMSLASPAEASLERPAAHGRLHLATGPGLLRLADRAGGFEVQFILMPFPTPNRFLIQEASQKYANLGEKNRFLTQAFVERMNAELTEPQFRRGQPAVLVAHLTVIDGDEVPLFRMAVQEDIRIFANDLPPGFDYLAFGHIHKPKAVGGRPHMRYPGSIDRLDLGEQSDVKGVLLLDIGIEGLMADPVTLPLEATPIYEVDIVSPKDQLPTLAERFANAERDLVNLHISYTAGEENLEQILCELDRVFPRWYARDWRETGELGPTAVAIEAERGKPFVDTVRDYLSMELVNHDEVERMEILSRAENLLQQAE